MEDLTCWALTEGFAGMENQCVGLAEAIGVRCEIKQVRRPRMPVKFLPPVLWPNPLASAVGEASLSPPWPDILISSGRGSVAAALAIRRHGAGKTFAIHIQTPYVAPSRFDVVVIPQHDFLRAENVVVTKTALHRVTKERLAEAVQNFQSHLTHLPRPLIAVLVGGSNRHQTCSSEIMTRMASQLMMAARDCGGALAVTTSRRTGDKYAQMLRDSLQGMPLFFWEGVGENPYYALLALADAIVVTSDSVSMVSEACAVGKPVHVFHMGDGAKKLRHFHQALIEDGVTRPFVGKIEQWSYDPPTETERVAAIIRERLRPVVRTFRCGNF